jgi:hypothetical protein
MKLNGLKSAATAICLFVCLLVSNASGRDSAKVAQAKYDALKAKIESGDLNID